MVRDNGREFLQWALTRRIPGTTLLVFLLMIANATHEGVVSVSIRELADMSGIGERTVQMALGKLRKRHRALERLAPSHGPGRPDIYRITGWPASD